MCKMLLTSNGFYTEAIKRKFLSVLPKPPSDISAVIITTASLEKESSKSAIKAKRDLVEMDIAHVAFLTSNMKTQKYLKLMMLFF